MKRTANIFVIFAVVICFGGVFAAASNEPRNQSTQLSVDQTQAKQEAKPIDKDQPDEIQKHYLVRLKNINVDLKDVHIAYRRNDIDYQFFKEVALLELTSWGRIPRNVEIKRKETRSEKIRLEEKRNNLNKEKENLKLDALKYYNGNMPKWLAEKWQEEEEDYSNYINEH